MDTVTKNIKVYYVVGTAPHFWDVRYQREHSKFWTNCSRTDKLSIFNFSSVGPFYSIADAKQWVYKHRIEYTKKQTQYSRAIYQDLESQEAFHRNLGLDATKSALIELEKKNPELTL